VSLRLVRVSSSGVDPTDLKVRIEDDLVIRGECK